jgi:membrane fusion protein (multidrug efflux system)
VESLTGDRGRDERGYTHDLVGDEVVRSLPDQPGAPATAIDEPEPVRISKARLRARLLIGGLFVLVIGALLFYLHGGRYEGTENASLQAGQVGVAANVSGQVIAVEVHENQDVKAGQVLFRIDPQPYQAAVAEAEARLADARAQIFSRRATYRQNKAGVQSAQAQLDYAAAEAVRQKQLLAEGISSRNQYDQAVLAVQTARQAIQTSSQQAESVRAGLGGEISGGAESQPAVAAAQAVLQRARLNLSYTVVRAAQDGVVTRVNQLQVGNYVSAARPVFMLVGKRIWVEANYKENQLRYMRLGQPATVSIDACPGHTLKAHLTSFSPGTGSSFALLPAENATGNWVKVVQRLPVEFTLDEVPADLPLHAGLSADVSVDTGHVRHLFGAD